MILAVIFDLDGTLVETEELKALSYARAAVELRPELREADVVDAFKDFVGLSRMEAAKGLMQRFGLEAAAWKRASELGVSASWQAFVQVRQRIYEAMLNNPELLLSQRYGDHSKTGANWQLAMKVPSCFPSSTDADVLC